MSEPRYWMHETSGVLRPVVEAYLNNRTLSERDIAILRQYLRQWIMAPAWDANPFLDVISGRRLKTLRQDIDGLTSRDAISDWLAEASEFGMDPL